MYHCFIVNFSLNYKIVSSLVASHLLFPLKLFDEQSFIILTDLWAFIV